MQGKSRVAGVDEARTRLPEILNAANADGTVTIVTKRGVPYAAIVPVSQVLHQPLKLTDLRGSATGYYGDAGVFIEGLRSEWP